MHENPPVARMGDLLPSEIVDDMRLVDAAIREALDSSIALIRQVGSHIVLGGGKRVRPMLLLLVARACNCRNMEAASRLAAVVEIFHTTTLLHDDVVDVSEMRRGQQTANVRFGNAASVLVGDFLYSKAFQMMVSLDRMPILQALAEATSVIAEGEVLQLINRGDTALSEADYLRVVECKTAKLFEVSARMGAMIAESSQALEALFAGYGKDLGVAFQVIDDLLDFFGDEETIGKSVGDDLAEGKTTLPLIYAMARGSEEERRAIVDALTTSDRNRLPSVLRVVEATGAIEMTRAYARRLAECAIEKITSLDDSQYKKTLIQLPRFVVERTF